MIKHYLFVAIVIFICNSLYSQWAPIGAKWYFDHYAGAQPYLTIIESIKDTVILNKQCKVLKTYEIDEMEHSTGFYYWDTINYPLQYLYYDSSKVYVYNSKLNNFYMLYNFNAKTGDTITVWNLAGPPKSLFQYKIDSISDTIIHGIKLIKQFTSATLNADYSFYNFNPPYHSTIIERIGSLQYLFGASTQIVMEGPVSHIRCYGDSNISYHFPTDNFECDYLYSLPSNISEKINLNDNIKIFPNPTSDVVTIDFKGYQGNDKANVEVYNIEGELVRASPIHSSITQLNVSDLVKGVYVVKVIDDNSVSVKKIVKE